jgi:hypothetical protein
LSPAEYRNCLRRLWLSQRAAARFFGRDERTARKWAEDKSTGPPPEVAMWLRYMLATKSTPEDVQGWIALYEDEASPSRR